MPDENEIQASKNAPHLIPGRQRLVKKDGNSADVTLCRGGGSNNEPYCGGTHNRSGFIADEASSASG